MNIDIEIKYFLTVLKQYLFFKVRATENDIIIARNGINIK